MKIKRTSIHTGGQPIPGLPFQGETMTCVVCGKQETSDPQVEKNWRAVEWESQRYYACPDHFPRDHGTTEQFKQAYLVVLCKIIELKGKRP